MSVVVIYKEESEHARVVEDFLRDFRMQTGMTIDTLNPDSREGEHFCRTYDVVQYPTMLALSDNSQMLSMWPGVPLPRISEVSYYA